MAEEMKFKSAEDEIEYWKALYEEKSLEFTDLEEEYQDFQDSSRELEKELEKELQQTQSKFEQLDKSHQRLKQTYEDLLVKSREEKTELNSFITKLQGEITKISEREKDLLFQRQKLEQENDNLERREREGSASLSNLSDRIDKLLEENVYTQNEYEELKINSQEIIQRLRDEIRDQKHELSIRNSQLLAFQKASNPSSSLNTKSTKAAHETITDILSLLLDLEVKVTKRI